MKLKRVRPSSPTPTPTPAPSPMPSGEKVKTSFYLDHTVLARAKAQARSEGLSLNAYVTTALNRLYHATTHPKTDAALAPAGMAELIQAVLASRSVPPSPASPSPAPRSPAPPPDPLARFGPGVTMGGDGIEPDVFATWEDIEKFATVRAARPEDDFMTVGRAAGIEFEAARAADYAVDAGEWDRYRKARKAARLARKAAAHV